MKNISIALLVFVAVYSNLSAQTNVGIGNNGPLTKLDVSGALSVREGNTLSLSTGNNNNVALPDIPTTSDVAGFCRIVAPTGGAFTITGIVPATSANGQIVTLVNTTGQAMTLANVSASSNAANRIYTQTGANLVDNASATANSSVTLQYSQNAGGTGVPGWIVTASQNYQIPSSAANGAFILNQTTQQPSSNFNITGNGTIGTTAIIGTGDATASPAGGILRAPNAGTGNNAGGSVTMSGGYGWGNAPGGNSYIYGGATGAAAYTNGSVYLRGGYNTSTTATSEGSVYVNDDHTGSTYINTGGGTTTIGGLTIFGTGEATASPSGNSGAPGNTLRAPNASGTNIPGANISVIAGWGTGNQNGGSAYLVGGTTGTGSNGNAYVRGGYSNGAEGAVYINDDHGGTTNVGGTLVMGTGDATGSPVGTTIRAPYNGTGGNGGTLNIAGGSGYGNNANGGDVIVTGGALGSSGYNGNVRLRAGSSSITNTAGNVYINDAANGTGYGATVVNPNGGTIQLGSGTGIPYLTAGVLSIASAGTNYQAPISPGTGLYYSSANTLASYWTLSGNNLYNNNNSGAGFVGIGTNGTPSTILHVKTSGSTFVTVDAASGSQAGFNLDNATATKSNIYFDPTTATYGTNGALLLNNTGSSAPNTIFNLQGGSVGIGVAQPASLFDVKALSTNNSFITIDNSNASAQSGINFYVNGTGKTNLYFDPATTWGTNGGLVANNYSSTPNLILNPQGGYAGIGLGTSGAGAVPGTELDVNGAITLRETAVSLSGTTATVPSNVSQYRIYGSPGGTVTLSAPATAPPNAGQTLVIYNNTTGGYAATFASVTIPNGQAQEFIYSNSTWVASGGISTGNGNYIENQTASSQTAGFNISTTGEIGGNLIMGTGDGTTPSGNTSSTYNIIRAANAGSSSTEGGNLALNGGYGYGSGIGGSVYINGGTTSTNGTNGSIYIRPGGTVATGVTAGNVTINDQASGANSSTYGNTYINPNGGEVGIGTTSPGYTLDVNGNVRANTTYHTKSTYGPIVQVGDDAYINDVNEANTMGIIGQENTSYGGLALGTGGAYLYSNGGANIGIGTTTPSQTLQIINSTGLYSNSEAGSSGLSIVTSASPSSGSGDYILYMGADRTNKVSYIQSVNYDCCTASLLLNARGGDVCIGTATAVTLLTVGGGGVSGSVSGGQWFNSSGTHTGLGSIGNLVAYFEGDVDATGSYCAGSSSFTASDARLKKVLGFSDGNSDLNTLEKIKITNYRYIDSIGTGNEPQKKVIAQQVESVYPQAVKTHPGYVPDIYCIAGKFEFDSSARTLKIYVDKDDNLKKGDKVQWIDETGSRHYSEVSSVSGKRCFFVSADKQPEKIFVYGRGVDDLRMVDYDALSMLNISATQELARKVELLEKQNAELKDENCDLKNAKADAADVIHLQMQNNDLQKQLNELKELMEKNGIRSEK